MIRGKSLVAGSVIVVSFLLGGGWSATAAESGSAGSISLQAKKVEREISTMETRGGRSTDSVRCKRGIFRDWDAGMGKLKAFKCRIRYDFGSDTWEWAYWLPKFGHISIMESIRTPGYRGDWYVDCRQTESKGFCLKSGKRQMRGCMDSDDDRGYCFRVIYGHVNLKTGRPHKGSDPQIISTKADAGDLARIVGTGGCYPRVGIMPPCAPDIPVTVGTGRFTTRTDTRVLTFGEVAVTAAELEPGVPGTAEVSVQLKLNGTDLVPARKVQLTGGDQVKIPFQKQFFLAEGSHEVSVEISGRGFDHVNVSGESARLKVFASRVRK